MRWILPKTSSYDGDSFIFNDGFECVIHFNAMRGTKVESLNIPQPELVDRLIDCDGCRLRHRSWSGVHAASRSKACCKDRFFLSSTNKKDDIMMMVAKAIVLKDVVRSGLSRSRSRGRHRSFGVVL